MTDVRQYPLVEKALQEYRTHDYQSLRHPETDFASRELEACRILEDALDRPAAEKESLMAASIILGITDFDVDRNALRAHLAAAFNPLVAHIVDDYRHDTCNNSRPQDLWQITAARFTAEMRDLSRRLASGQASPDDIDDARHIVATPAAEHANITAKTKSQRLTDVFNATKTALQQAVAPYCTATGGNSFPKAQLN